MNAAHLKFLLCIAAVLLLSNPAKSQTDYFGGLASVTLSNNSEESISTYTLVCNPVVDTEPVLPANGYSYAAAGNTATVIFPSGTNLSLVASVTITIGGTPYTVPAVPNSGYIDFVMPAALARGQGFTIMIPNVINPPFRPSCLTNPNVYYEGSGGPCDDLVYVGIQNATNGANFYHHFGIGMFSIAPRNYFVRSVTAERTNASPAPFSTIDNEMLLLKIEIGGSMGPLPQLNAVTFSTGSTTSTADISTARIWFTGNKKYFHAPGETLLGSFPSPSGNFTAASLTQPLSETFNFVWLAYDLICDASTVGHTLDGDIISVFIDGLPVPVSNPSGTRQVGPFYTSPTANVVPNPGFETFSACPTGWTQPSYNAIVLATGWNYLTPAFGGSSDYFNACAPSGQASVPNNFSGTQAAHGGNAYGGIGGRPSFFEYLTAPLSSTLLQDTTYYVSFYVSSGDTFGSGNPVYKTNGLGALFTSAPVAVVDPAQVIAPAQFQYAPVVYDQQDWLHVFGTFTATGTENRITIGNFANAYTIDTVATNAYADIFSVPGTYWYVDDVTVCKLSQVTVPCSSGPLAMDQPFLKAEVYGRHHRLSWVPSSAFAPERYELLAGASSTQMDALAVFEESELNGEYSFIHLYPSEGQHFYQLRQWAPDGSYSLSNRVELSREESAVSVSNPVNDRIRIFGWMGDCTFRLLNIEGREVLNGTTNASQIEVSTLSRGIYFLELNSGEQFLFRGKIVKE